MLPSIHVKLRKDKTNKKGEQAIVLQLYYDKKQKQIFTGVFIDETFFVKGEVLKSHPNYHWINQVIKSKVRELEQTFLKQSLESNVELTQKAKVSRKNFADYANDYYDGLKNKASEKYIGKCKAAIKEFKAFAGDVNFQQVTPSVLKGFEDHLFNIGRARNTINYVFKKIKQPFDHANKNKETDYNPFTSFQPVTYKQTKREYLTLKEIEHLRDLDLPKELQHIRDYFVLCCYTGLRFSDAAKFTKEKYIININGIERIIVGTTKTNEIVSIKLLKHIRDIINRISRKLPSNKHTNQLLKTIGSIAEFEAPLNFHKSRHSFAVNSASFGIPIEAVAKLLGHSNIKTTAIYYKIADTKIDEYMDRWEK